MRASLPLRRLPRRSVGDRLREGILLRAILDLGPLRVVRVALAETIIELAVRQPWPVDTAPFAHLPYWAEIGPSGIALLLGHDQDAAIYNDFRRQHPGWFPNLLRAHRTTFARQAANLWAVKERRWAVLLDRLVQDPALSFVDSVPTPVCRFGRARGARFRDEAAFGRDTGEATFYGFRHHFRVSWPGVVTALQVAPANAHDLEVVPELVAEATGQFLGDRNSWDPKLTAELAPAGIALCAPFKKRATDPDPAGSRLLTRVRWRIETMAAQFAERYQLKRLWARDVWHLTSRVLRKVLSHTIAVCLCRQTAILHPTEPSGLW